MIPSSYLAPSAVIAALSALSFHSEVQGQQATHAIHLLKPQDYYGRRAFGSLGQAWLGVYELNGTWEIRASRIRIDTIPTPRACAREVTKVSVDERQQPLFLIQGLQGLAQGPIEVPFVGSVFVEPGTTLDFHLAPNHQYRLRAYGTRHGPPSDPTFAGYELRLEHGTRSQLLAQLGVVEAGQPAAVLAGDLDRDHQLDLVLDLHRSYVGHRYTLFLSSTAGPDSLVARVAELEVLGC